MKSPHTLQEKAPAEEKCSLNEEIKETLEGTANSIVTLVYNSRFAVTISRQQSGAMSDDNIQGWIMKKNRALGTDVKVPSSLLHRNRTSRPKVTLWSHFVSPSVFVLHLDDVICYLCSLPFFTKFFFFFVILCHFLLFNVSDLSFFSHIPFCTTTLCSYVVWCIKQHNSANERYLTQRFYRNKRK